MCHGLLCCKILARLQKAHPSFGIAAHTSPFASCRTHRRLSIRTMDQQQPTRLLEYTALGDIKPGVDRLRTAFHHNASDLQARLNVLRDLYFAIRDNAQAFCDALYLDFKRLPHETMGLEVLVLLTEFVEAMSHLRKWMEPKRVGKKTLALVCSHVSIEKCPLGVVLVISPSNYPLLLSVSPLVGALAAGNRVVLKLSEHVPHFSSLLTRVLSECLHDKDYIFVVNGAIAECDELLKQKFDKIMYTGNPTVGKIVARKAAETLTPIILELGGKSPAFVLQDVRPQDIPTIARRLVWGRFTNGGQTCIAIDYVLVHESVHARLVQEMEKVIAEFYPDQKEISHIIHEKGFAGMQSLLESSKGRVVTGGVCEPRDRLVTPTILDNVDWDDAVMLREIFGPVLPILQYSDVQQAVSQVIEHHDTPLAQHVFTSKSMSRAKNLELDLIMSQIRLGSVIVNDSLFQGGLYSVPFGGVGESGHGAYHGEFSFNLFSHLRTVIALPLWSEKLLEARYPPWTRVKGALFKAAGSLYGDKVWFGRVGDVSPKGPSPLFRASAFALGVGSVIYWSVRSMMER